MTTPADARAAEAAFEAAVAGRPVPAGARGLTAFTAAVRAEATAPGRPNAALAELLATGLLPDASTRTVGRSARSSRKRPRMILSTLVAKFLAAGAVAKAATAGGAVAIALTGAVTTDVLPLTGDDPAVVDSGDAAPDTTDGVAPDGSDPGDDAADDDAADDDAAADDQGDGPAEDPADDATDGETPEDVAGPAEPLSYADWLAGPVEGEPFGQWVSAGAHEGWTTGALVSCFAQARQGKPDKPDMEDCRALAAPPVEEDPAGTPPVQEPVDPTEGTDPDAGEDDTVEPAPAPTAATGSSGHGNGSGGGHGGANGNGNGGGHGSGNGNGGGNGGGRR